jgi:hypothetical protein
MFKNNYLTTSVLASAMFFAGSTQAAQAIGSSAQPIRLSISVNNTWTNPLSINSENSYVSSGHITGYTLTGSEPSYIQDYPTALYQYVSAGIYTPLNAFINLDQFSTEAGQRLIGQFEYADGLVGDAGTSSCLVTYNFSQTVATATATPSGSITANGCAVESVRAGAFAALNVSITTKP